MNFSFTKKNLLKYSIFLLVIFPAFSFAQVSFSEIMFDPEGSDSDREWVEIKNTYGSSINLEKYKFCDSGSCHKLYESGASFKIPGNSFGIIAKKPENLKLIIQIFQGLF